MQPSIGVLDRLYARVLYLSQGAETIAWLHCDLIGFERDFAQAARADVGAALGIASDRVVLSATHTHSGPPTIRLLEAGRYDDSYVAALLRDLISLAVTAAQEPEACAIQSSSSLHRLACNRRKEEEPEGTLCTSLRFVRPDGSLKAVFANYAVHPVALGSANRMISGDIHGLAPQSLGVENAILFMTNGACGDLNPPAEGLSHEGALGLATGLLDAVLSAPGHDVPDGLLLSSKTINLDYQTLSKEGIDTLATRCLQNEWARAQWPTQLPRAVEQWRENRLHELQNGTQPKSVEAEIQAIRLGDTRWVTVSAELFSQASRDIGGRDNSVTLICYANGLVGYLPPETAYAEGGYEVDLAPLFYDRLPFKVGGYERLVNAADEQLRSL
ncbi:MAG: hypothetical protein ACHQ50_17260 [Fimbriimonadales bacterium]